VPSSAKTFDRFLVLLAVLGVLTVGLALVAALRAPAEGSDGVGTAAAGAGDQGPQAVTATIELSEFAIDGTLEVPAGDLTIELVNAGTMIHNLAFEDGPVSEDIAGGETTTFHVGELAPGTYTIFCAIAGHREAGMEATLVVTESASGSTSGGDVVAAADHSGHGGDGGLTAEEMDQMMIDSMLAFPAETEGRGNQLLEPTEIREDGTKVYDITASIIDWEVSPGQFIEGWAYNEQIPGPWIRAEVGDKLEFNVTNETPMGTDVHWHGIRVPFEMDGVAPFTQDPIRTGDTFTYTFEAVEPAIGMYHAHMHGQTSVVNGMFGPFQIDEAPIPYGRTVGGVEIPEDLEIAAEFPMVLNDAGTVGLTLNGKSFPATEPYFFTEGDWFVVHYYNEGLQVHPMHLHKLDQLIFAKDGFPLDSPYWADTINIAPGERYSALVHANQVGTWMWHCHILTHVEKSDGMYGMATAVIVDPA
jgi:FtsP/CotA-like multicopper oxidase with cupredoxin domain